MPTNKRAAFTFPGTYSSHEVASESECLEHQHWRLTEILDGDMVSREMADHLRRRLSEIDRRISQIGGTVPSHGRFLTPARDEGVAVL